MTYLLEYILLYFNYNILLRWRYHNDIIIVISYSLVFM